MTEDLNPVRGIGSEAHHPTCECIHCKATMNTIAIMDALRNGPKRREQVTLTTPNWQNQSTLMELTQYSKRSYDDRDGRTTYHRRAR